jgi:hypothetical protein
MIFKRLLLYACIAFSGFASGVVAERLWKVSLHRWTEVTAPIIEREWPLTKELVSRSLQSHSFRTDKLRKNSNDEVVWRWLKDSIATYPQNWVKLNISDSESYEVVLYPLSVIDESELDFYNKELEKKGLPLLEKGKRYQPINVYRGSIICPNWSGIIDVEEARLVYFAGSSA